MDTLNDLLWTDETLDDIAKNESDEVQNDDMNKYCMVCFCDYGGGAGNVYACHQDAPDRSLACM